MSEAVRLDELASGLSRRGAVLAPESALFIALEALESLGSRALVLSASSVLLSAEGTVSLGGTLDFAPDETSVLEGVLETLEGVLAPVPIGVVELAVKVRGAQIISRNAMLSELSAMLVPLNRRAARRMVGRLVREHLRPHHAGVADAETDAIADAQALLSHVNGGADDVSDTVLDAPTLEASAPTARSPRAPTDSWSDEPAPLRRRATERRNGWIAVAFALATLVAAVAFLVHRVNAAGA